MRGLAACLAGVLALGALGAMAASMSACSDSTDASGGAGGATAAGGSHSGGTAGSAGGDASTGGDSGVTCSFNSDECNTCLLGKCKEPLSACGSDASCGEALQNLTICVCNPKEDPTTCIGDFVTEQGNLGRDLAECYTLNKCDEVCQ